MRPDGARRRVLRDAYATVAHGRHVAAAASPRSRPCRCARPRKLWRRVSAREHPRAREIKKWSSESCPELRIPSRSRAGMSEMVGTIQIVGLVHTGDARDSGDSCRSKCLERARPTARTNPTIWIVPISSDIPARPHDRIRSSRQDSLTNFLIARARSRNARALRVRNINPHCRDFPVFTGTSRCHHRNKRIKMSQKGSNPGYGHCPPRRPRGRENKDRAGLN